MVNVAPFTIPMPSDAFAERMILIESQASQTDPYPRSADANAGAAGTMTINQAGTMKGAAGALSVFPWDRVTSILR